MTQEKKKKKKKEKTNLPDTTEGKKKGEHDPIKRGEKEGVGRVGGREGEGKRR